VTLLAFAAERRPCSNRSISPGRRAHSSKPAAAACGGFAVVGQTDSRQTYCVSSVNKRFFSDVAY